MSGSAPTKPKSAGIPPWMATFADLMALMMCFFVLLFAFSEVETEKFKQMAGSMAAAFGGVQFIKSNSEDMVKGMEAGVVSKTGNDASPFDPSSRTPAASMMPHTIHPSQSLEAQQRRRNEELMEELKTAMADEIAAGNLMLERDHDDVVIRFPEHVSFASGRADLVPGARPLIDRIIKLIAEDQMIIVAGHTDDRPLAGGIYGSNWALSAARAASVADQVLQQGQLPPNRMVVAGYADTRPIMPNDTDDNRARNRRVEIIVKPINDNPASENSNPQIVIQ